jgi:hypothetical protein
MSGADQTVSFRAPEDVIKDADKLAKLWKDDAKLRASGRVKRSTILRLALIRGMEVLKAEQQSEAEREKGKR